MQQLHDFEATELHEPFNERKSLQAPAQSTAQIGKDSLKHMPEIKSASRLEYKHHLLR